LAQAIQAASSTGAAHFGQRAATNGSADPQKGQRATSRAMNLPQAGHGCLKVGIVAPQLEASAAARRVVIPGCPHHLLRRG
jgi:hypothetical protein